MQHPVCLSGPRNVGVTLAALAGAICPLPVLPFHRDYGPPSCQLAVIGSPMNVHLFDPCGSVDYPCFGPECRRPLSWAGNDEARAWRASGVVRRDSTGGGDDGWPRPSRVALALARPAVHAPLAADLTAQLLPALPRGNCRRGVGVWLPSAHRSSRGP